MADLESLNYRSISDMSPDEALALIKSIRLSRRTPKKRIRKQKVNSKSVSRAASKKLSKSDISEILKMIGG